MKVNISISAKFKFNPKKYSWFKTTKPLKVKLSLEDEALAEFKAGELFGIRSVGNKIYIVDGQEPEDEFNITDQEHGKFVNSSNLSTFNYKNTGKPKLTPARFASFMRDRATYRVPLKDIVSNFVLVKTMRKSNPYFLLVEPENRGVPAVAVTDDMAGEYFETDVDTVKEFLLKKGIRTMTIQKARRGGLI